MTDGCDISSKIAVRWISLDLSDDKSTLVQVMAWCHQVTSHYMNQCWPRSLPLYGVTRPQWVKCLLLNPITYQWPSARLQYLQCISNGDTAVLHQAISFVFLNSAQKRAMHVFLTRAQLKRLALIFTYDINTQAWIFFVCLFVFLFPILYTFKSLQLCKCHYTFNTSIYGWIQVKWANQHWGNKGLTTIPYHHKHWSRQQRVNHY